MSCQHWNHGQCLSLSLVDLLEDFTFSQNGTKSIFQLLTELIWMDNKTQSTCLLFDRNNTAKFAGLQLKNTRIRLVLGIGDTNDFSQPYSVFLNPLRCFGQHKLLGRGGVPTASSEWHGLSTHLLCSSPSHSPTPATPPSRCSLSSLTLPSRSLQEESFGLAAVELRVANTVLGQNGCGLVPLGSVYAL